MPRRIHGRWRAFSGTRLLAASFMLMLLLPWNVTGVYLLNNLSSAEALRYGTPQEVEALFVRGLMQIAKGRLDEALRDMENVVKMTPNFRLAHLVRGDLLRAKASELNAFGDIYGVFDSKIKGFCDEARVRLDRYFDSPAALGDHWLWRLDPGQQHAILVDATTSRLYVYRNEYGTPRYMADYYVTVGKNGMDKKAEGDKRTPLGVYLASRSLDMSKLPDFYGEAAYPLDYPNEWDRHRGRDGHGIWLHGTSRTIYSRAPLASDGCIVMANPDIAALASIMDEGNTPVIVVSDKNPVMADQIKQQREQLLRALEEWRSDWEQQNTEAYLDKYSKDFFSEEQDFEAWAERKRRIQKNKIQTSITLSNVSVFRYPDPQQQMAVINFTQYYKSTYLNDRVRKRQYWLLDDGQWKILYEGIV